MIPHPKLMVISLLVLVLSSSSIKALSSDEIAEMGPELRIRYFADAFKKSVKTSDRSMRLAILQDAVLLHRSLKENQLKGIDLLTWRVQGGVAREMLAGLLTPEGIQLSTTLGYDIKRVIRLRSEAHELLAKPPKHHNAKLVELLRQTRAQNAINLVFDQLLTKKKPDVAKMTGLIDFMLSVHPKGSRKFVQVKAVRGKALLEFDQNYMGVWLKEAQADLSYALARIDRHKQPSEWLITALDLVESILRQPAPEGEKPNQIETILATARQIVNERGTPLIGMMVSVLKGEYLLKQKGGCTDRAAQRSLREFSKAQALVQMAKKNGSEDKLLEMRITLGAAHAWFCRRHWKNAFKFYEKSRSKLRLLLYRDSISIDVANARIPSLMRRGQGIYTRGVYALLKLGRTRDALNLFDEGRAVLLRTIINDRGLAVSDQIFSGSTHKILLKTQQNVNKRIALQNASRRKAGLSATTFVRMCVPTRANRFCNPYGPPLETLENIPTTSTADYFIIAPIITRIGTLLIVLSSDRGKVRIYSKEVPGLTDKRLQELLGSRTKGGYLRAFDQQSDNPDAWHDKLNETATRLYQLIGKPIDQLVGKKARRAGSRLYIITDSRLGYLPLGVAYSRKERRYLAHSYALSYSPSFADALNALKRKAPKNSSTKLAAILNPTEDLGGTETEGGLIASHFFAKNRRVLRRKQATHEAVLAAIKGKAYLHFAGHAFFDPVAPLAGGLILHKDKVLSVGDLLNNYSATTRPRLVVLSACETTLNDIDANPLEPLGLTAAFFSIGAKGVIGTLWQVNDISSTILMVKFYELHLKKGITPALALSRAKNWLSSKTHEELYQYIKSKAVAATIPLATDWRDIINSFRARGQRALIPFKGGLHDTNRPVGKGRFPFSHPYYWAGYVLTGD